MNMIVFSLFAFVVSESLFRSIGGRNATDGEFPFILGLEINIVNTWLSVCSGSALTPTWGLTAAHCFGLISDTKKVNIPFRVRYNSLIAGAMGETSDIISLVKHTRNDIALVKTLRMNVHGFAKLSSVDYRSLFGKHAIGVGYGLTNVTYKYEGSSLDTLQVVEGMLAKCERYRQYSHTSICLLPRCNTVEMGAPGDSGGPVIHLSGVVGVCVEGPVNYDHLRHHLPTTFKKLETVVCAMEAVSLFLDWIRYVVAT